jgi:UPF0755 protein
MIIGVGFAFLLAAAGIGFSAYRYAVTPVGGSQGQVRVWIKPGQGFFQTMDQLVDSGLIKRRETFRWLAYITGYETRIRAGEYRLSASQSPLAMLETLVRGEVVLHRVVVPEGETMAGIADIIEKEGLLSKKEFLDAACDADLAEALHIEGKNLEGYLFPETYFFSKGATAEEIIRKMVAQFQSVFNAQWNDRAREMGFSVHEVVTLASIVEKETAKDDERPVVASVFLNRLEKQMRLESDPTVIYGIENFNGNITQKDLRNVTPYNTYRIKGLPPGPISNPGKASLEAVLYPSETSYFYFVSKRDGYHHFSNSFGEHGAMVRKYQVNRH